MGNRFNILFYDAAGVYFLNEHMLNYLTRSHGNTLNRLLQLVLNDLQASHLLVALGIIDKLITGPFGDISKLQSYQFCRWVMYTQ